MYPRRVIVHSILLLARFSSRWEGAHFLWEFGLRPKENPRPEPGAGEMLGLSELGLPFFALTGGRRGGRSGGR